MLSFRKCLKKWKSGFWDSKEKCKSKSKFKLDEKLAEWDECNLFLKILIHYKDNTAFKKILIRIPEPCADSKIIFILLDHILLIQILPLI